MRQHRNAKCVTFTCLHDDTAQSIYSLLCLNIPFRDPVLEFLRGKEGIKHILYFNMLFIKYTLEPEIYDLHQVLVKHHHQISARILTLPESYRIQLSNLLDHLLHIDKENYIINFRESFIFTNAIENDDDDNDVLFKTRSDKNDKDSLINNEDQLFKNIDINTRAEFETTTHLRNTANPQQKFLLDFLQEYFNHLMQHSRRPSYVAKPKPFHIVVNGLAGSGKSYVISIIEKMIQEYCISESATVSRPRKNLGLLKMAHTGKAALNIHGSTIHSALEICPDGNASPNKINSFKLYTLRNRLNGLLLIIIDEISLVSHGLFQKINKRLNEIFRTFDKSDTYFGGIPVIAFGDMAQIEPVAAKQVFYRPSGELFSLWHDLFRPINFDINMRQGNDRLFFDYLCRMRMGCLDEESEMLLKSRSIREQDNPDGYKDRLKELNSPEFEDAMYAYGTRKLTNARNITKLKKHALATKNPIFMINAVDKVAMVDTSFFKSSNTSRKNCKINLNPSSDENKCGSLYQRFPICVGARVLIRRNIDQENYIVNGTDAIVKEIVWEDPRDFLTAPVASNNIFSELTNVVNTKLPKYVELELSNGQRYKLEPQETRFNDMNNVAMTRLQLPLALGYAITIHRTQCMTYSKLVIDLAGKYWKPGMFYTVVSRTRHITDIIILAYDRKSFKVSIEGLNEIERLQRIEREHPIKIDDYLNNFDVPLPNTSSIDVIIKEETNKKCKDHLGCTNNKRRKTSTNINNNIHNDIYNEDIHPEDAIVCEEQQLLFCGRHALRAFVQNLEKFDDSSLVSIGQELATQELLIHEQERINQDIYYSIEDGFYHIEVIQNALREEFNIELIQLEALNRTAHFIYEVIMNNIHDVQAFFIHKGNHYFCVRRFDNTADYFFIIDSFSPNMHETIPRNRILDYIEYLRKNDGLIYIPVSAHLLQMHSIPSDLLHSVLHPLPTCDADQVVFTVNERTNFTFS
ncbi:unnamed protein product [Adineta steineri]|uniref:ATP-dependent DNA helicase n=2 Tax=Adineta steineri TaxID=433720 RepID=A0A813XXZ9_9BILA|nr:unnamed protein product [Adineta steineri]